LSEARQNRLYEVIMQAVTETVENMAFSVIEPLESLPDVAGEVIAASLTVLEPKPAPIRLLMPVPTARALARSLYNSEDPDLTQDMLTDVAGELLNMIAGALMRHLLPPDTPFRLGLPEIKFEPVVPNKGQESAWAFTADGQPFIIMADDELVKE